MESPYPKCTYCKACGNKCKPLSFETLIPTPVGHVKYTPEYIQSVIHEPAWTDWKQCMARTDLCVKYKLLTIWTGRKASKKRIKATNCQIDLYLRTMKQRGELP